MRALDYIAGILTAIGVFVVFLIHLAIPIGVLVLIYLGIKFLIART